MTEQLHIIFWVSLFCNLQRNIVGDLPLMSRNLQHLCHSAWALAEEVVQSRDKVSFQPILVELGLSKASLQPLDTPSKQFLSCWYSRRLQKLLVRRMLLRLSR